MSDSDVPTEPDYSHHSAIVYVDPAEVVIQVDKHFKLSPDVFRFAALAALAESRKTTRDDAEGAAGFYAWTRGLRTLRVGARREGQWHNDKLAGIPATFNPEESVCVTVSSGDEFTGWDGPQDPSTKNIKGPAAARAIDSNVLRYDDYAPFEDVAPDFWYLLIFIFEEGVRAELAKPVYQDDSGKISRWQYRIVLGTIAPDGGDGVSRTADQPGPGAEPVDVPVARKSA